MKKLLVILFFISAVSSMGISQSFLTVGQVYNFNIGDVFETELYTAPTQGPPTYNLSIILAKWYSVHSDTVLYKDSSVLYTPPPCPPTCTGNFSESVVTVFYTNLNSKAIQDTEPNNCPTNWDSTYIDYSLYCEEKVLPFGFITVLVPLPILTRVNFIYFFIQLLIIYRLGNKRVGAQIIGFIYHHFFPIA